MNILSSIAELHQCRLLNKTAIIGLEILRADHSVFLTAKTATWRRIDCYSVFVRAENEL